MSGKLKMRDDPDYNILFISLVEKNVCIYDFTLSEYSNRNIQDRTWDSIANELGESAHDCRERWKNLRACYTRYLKASKLPSGSNSRARKPYYLADYMTFLQPFTKPRSQSGNTPITVKSSPEWLGNEESTSDYPLSPTKLEEAGDFSEASGAAYTNFVSVRDQEAISENGNEVTGPPTKLKRLENAVATEDNPDLNFFKSLLPDLAEMSTNQKRRFKIGILNLAQEILNEPNSF